MVTEISCYRSAFPAGNLNSYFGLDDTPTTTPVNNHDYWISFMGENEWEIRQGSSDEMTIDPDDYSTTTPHVAKIVLTESGGAITSCKYYCNDVEITPSFSFSAKGSTGKTGFCLFKSVNPSGLDFVLNNSAQSWTSALNSPTISTTSHTNDTAEATSASLTQIATTSGDIPTSSTVTIPPPVAMVNI